ncbi:hypothetical protein AGABI2DRAFT_186909 [Agaricus bisporus var. bisporus H97]|uniref:hypothetical protein n=1 Tax=Agaricus bisporus var. bisporus (strain H97 / ATCC MYA-4626 / FGSC 10389) TaxID=936046 RepID=UPI00029F69B8|nr:hypothetical protein AGABI2DRAFT_186909 [Agaricus bisporus var. bisporus H97]EKV45135.1 hypothetical protein AGABI2DRAFT_186909 [Agaricus bisporus var. bisporus H97]
MASDALRSQVAAKWQESFARLNRHEPGIAGLVRFSHAWNVALAVLRPRRLDELKEDVDIELVRSAFAVINGGRRLPFLLETFLEELKKRYWMVGKDVEEYMARFEQTENAEVIRDLVLRLVAWFKHWAPLPEFRLGSTIYSAYTLSFQTHLFSIVPPSFATGFKALVSSTLSASASSTKSHGHDTDDPNAPIWQSFETLGLIDRYESIIATVGYEFIEHHVLDTCTAEWSRPMLSELRDWMSEKVVPWMLLIYARGATNAEEARAMLQGVGSRFDFHINKTLCDLRTKEIFDIIIDFPESNGALMDLKDCLQRVDQRPALVKALRQANRKRLLHPGADTKLILSQYVATIKCLRIIDPPGVLLFKVADPIRRYLRDRPDTIRCIVANLVGDDSDSPDSLLDDTIDSTSGGGGGQITTTNPAHLIDDYSDPNWDPEPIDAGPEFRANKPQDVLSTLVSIYDSQDLFVKEVQILLAQRLLSIPILSNTTVEDTNGTTERIEKERRTLEILKLRFGEMALGVCEVMLKDMTDSKRIDSHIQNQLSLSSSSSTPPSSADINVVHPTIISHHFWPSSDPSAFSSLSNQHHHQQQNQQQPSSSFMLPGQFKTLQSTYLSQFTKFKPDKTLRFLPNLGSVTLLIRFGDEREMEVQVGAIEAGVLELFNMKAMLSLDELIQGLGGIDKGSVLKALLTWIDYGVLEEVEGREGMFRVLEVENDRKRDGGGGGGGGEGEERTRQAVAAHVHAQESSLPPVVSAQQQQADQMRVYWKFIEGMLTNLGGLPIDRIQSMLRFAPGYDQSVDQLSMFLDAARREGVVVCREGMWRLNK